MSETERTAIEHQLAELRERVAQLEADAARVQAAALSRDWTHQYYLTYHATAGFFLGMIAALSSLAFNVVGSYLVGQHPLQIIKVYLTFGLGDKALAPTLDNSMVLVIGCCLYIATGMFLGIPFQLVFSRMSNDRSLVKRLLVASAIAIAIWIFNFYVILSWLQQPLFGGSWIVDPKLLPPWVAAATHLVFGWTMALIYPLGKFEPYRVENNS